MNYFGLFFSFMLPGMLIGAVTVAAVCEGRRARRERARQARRTAMDAERTAHSADKRLYIHSMSGDAA